MGVPEDQDVRARNVGREPRTPVLVGGVAAAFLAGDQVAFQPGVGEQDHHVALLLAAQALDLAPRRVHRRAECQALPVRRVLHRRDRGSGQPDHPDPHAADQLDDRGAERRLAAPGDVGREPREGGGAARALERAGAEAELVVPDRHRVVAHAAHHRGHRIGAGGAVAVIDRGQRRALDRVAPVEQQHRGALGAHRAHQARDLLQAAARRAVGEVVPRGQRAVDVGGVEDGDPRALGAGGGGGQEQQNQEEACEVAHGIARRYNARRGASSLVVVTPRRIQARLRCVRVHPMRSP